MGRLLVTDFYVFSAQHRDQEGTYQDAQGKVIACGLHRIHSSVRASVPCYSAARLVENAGIDDHDGMG